MKECSRCKKELPFSCFHKRSERKSGHVSACKECAIKPYTTEKQARQRSYKLMANFGMTVEQYDDLLIAQGNVCAICTKPETSRSGAGVIKRLAVDHNHSTGKVRGLLCENCNRGLGLFKEDEGIMQSAISYLKEKM